MVWLLNARLKTNLSESHIHGNVSEMKVMDKCRSLYKYKLHLNNYLGPCDWSSVPLTPPTASYPITAQSSQRQQLLRVVLQRQRDRRHWWRHQSETGLTDDIRGLICDVIRLGHNVFTSGFILVIGRMIPVKSQIWNRSRTAPPAGSPTVLAAALALICPSAVWAPTCLSLYPSPTCLSLYLSLWTDRWAVQLLRPFTSVCSWEHLAEGSSAH